MRTMAIILLVLSFLISQTSADLSARIRNQTLEVAEVGVVTYGVSVPADYAAARPRPLILALHPGGERMRGYGSRFMQQIVTPGLADLGAIIVAPDCPPAARSWADPIADRAVMALLDKVRQEYAIDARRVLVTGFSMGGRGTWYMASQHPRLFTGAIAIAASVGDLAPDTLATMPTYVIHSRDDQVVSFDQAERNARQLETLGRQIHFEALQGPGHYAMGGYIESLQRAGRWISVHWSKSK
jgi:predicted peptidase